MTKYVSETCRCPICDAPMTVELYTLDGWCREEETNECPNGCYKYNYSYGYDEVILGDLVFQIGMFDESRLSLGSQLWYIWQRLCCQIVINWRKK